MTYWVKSRSYWALCCILPIYISNFNFDSLSNFLILNILTDGPTDLIIEAPSRSLKTKKQKLPYLTTTVVMMCQLKVRKVLIADDEYFMLYWSIILH